LCYLFSRAGFTDAPREDNDPVAPPQEIEEHQNEPPSEADEGPVKVNKRFIDDPQHSVYLFKVLTKANFAEIVYDRTKDVLVDFYAPWCSHCHNVSSL
jgi:thioredoxin-like negative regulator of GroEL